MPESTTSDIVTHRDVIRLPTSSGTSRLAGALGNALDQEGRLPARPPTTVSAVPRARCPRKEDGKQTSQPPLESAHARGRQLIPRAMLRR